MPTLAAASSSSASPGRGRESRARTGRSFSSGAGSAVFIYGFPKSEWENIGADEEKEFKEAAKHVLALTEKQLAELVREGDFVEVRRT